MIEAASGLNQCTERPRRSKIAYSSNHLLAVCDITIVACVLFLNGLLYSNPIFAMISKVYVDNKCVACFFTINCRLSSCIVYDALVVLV